MLNIFVPLISLYGGTGVKKLYCFEKQLKNKLKS